MNRLVMPIRVGSVNRIENHWENGFIPSASPASSSSSTNRETTTLSSSPIILRLACHISSHAQSQFSEAVRALPSAT
jgi:hypothetical protein